MTILLLIAILGALFIANHQQSQGISRAHNAGIWAFCLLAFLILLTVASLVGAALPGTLANVP